MRSVRCVVARRGIYLMSDPSPTRYRVSVSAIVGKRQRGGTDVSKSLRFLAGLRERCRAIRDLATDHLQSHNLKVPGSNPGPATILICSCRRPLDRSLV